MDISPQNRTFEPAKFKLVSDFEPNGDQPKAIVSLLEGIRNKERDQVLLSQTL